MTFRKISLTFLIIILGAACANAKTKEPKYGQARQLTAEQAALVQKAVAREKVMIRAIKQRTPLVETYIQNTKPDIKLYAVPVSDTYILSRVDFGKAFADKPFEVRAANSSESKSGKHNFFTKSLESMTGLSKALGLERYTYSANGFMEMMFLDPTGFDTSTTTSALCGPSFWDRSAPGSMMCIRKFPAWAASMAAFGLRMRMATSSASTALTQGPQMPKMRPSTTSTSIAGG